MFFNIQLYPNWTLYHNLLQIYGINVSRINYICYFLGFNCNKLLKYFNGKQRTLLGKIFETNYTKTTGSRLKETVVVNIKTLIKIKNYRGIRHRKCLPTRGQHTRNNAKTARKLNKNLLNKNL